MSYDHDKLASLDVETECAVEGCTDSACEHALIPHTARITCVGVYFPGASGMEFRVFRSMDPLIRFLTAERPDILLVGANFKWDLKMLAFHGVEIPPARWVEDVVLQATASYEKIPAGWLAEYEERRKKKNKDGRLRGRSHRPGKRHSLKTLAPYFLGVDAFWETPWDHNNDAYLEKDCRYTYELCGLFRDKLAVQGTDKYYYSHLLPWAKMFLAAEVRGVKIDMDLLAVEEEKSKVRAAEARAKLDAAWAEPYAAAHAQKTRAAEVEYAEMAAAQLVKKPTDAYAQRAALKARYSQLCAAATAKIPRALDPDSPTDVMWILRDYYGLDTSKYDGDQSTGKEVLERLAGQGRADCRLLLDYREDTKLLTAFFAAYRALNRGGVLHGSFNLDVAKTGRTSSSGPNLQQVSGELHKLFVARDGFLLDTNDLSAIEPTLIAYLSEDRVLCELMMSGADFHGHCTNVVFGTNWDLATLKREHKRERDFVKEVDLSVFYGAGWRRVQHSSFKHGFSFSPSEARRAVDRLRSAWPGVTEFKRMVDEMARSGPLENLFGFKRSFADNPEDIYMQAFNGLVQGSASMLLLDSSARAHAEQLAAGLEVYPLLWVHDESVDEVRREHAEQARAIKVRAMTSYKLETKWGVIPLKVEGKLSERWEK